MVVMVVIRNLQIDDGDDGDGGDKEPKSMMVSDKEPPNR